MSDEHPPIADSVLGVFVRATGETDDGSVLTYDWYTGSADIGGETVELMLEGADPDEARKRLPRLRAGMADLHRVQRAASDAVVATFSQGDPSPHDLDEGASDLLLEAVEAGADGSIVLHFTDACGEHFPEGYWPAAHLADDDTVATVTVES